MPYNPEAQFNAGLGLVGVQNVAQEIAEARKRYDENQKLGAYNDSLVRHAYQTGQISLDELNDYQQAAGNKKTGIAAGLAASMLDNHNREKERQQQAYQNAQIEHLNAEAAYNNAHAAALQTPETPFAPSIVPLKGPNGEDYPVLMTSPHSAAPLRGPEGADGPIANDPVLDPTGKPIPGVLNNRKTGQYFYYNTGGAPVPVERDPQTGSFFYRNLKGEPKALTGGNVQAGMLAPEASPSPAPAATTAPKPKPGDIVRGYRFKGGNPADQNNWELVP
jgi:hypothetical protein